MIPVGFLLMALLIAVRLISQGTSGADAHLKNSDH
jgi:hypothetical protein